MPNGWGEEEYDFYAIYVDNDALSGGDSDFRRLLEHVSFVYFIGDLLYIFFL
jgi:hypothetical protein